MKLSLQKSHIKPSLFVLLIFLITFLLLNLLGTLLFSKNKDFFADGLGKHFGQRILIRKISYSFPFRVSLSGVSIYSDQSEKSSKLIDIEKIQLNISLIHSIRKRELVLSTACLFEPVFNYPKCQEFVSEHYQEIIDFIKSLPSDQDIRFLIKKGKLNLSPESPNPGIVNLEAFIDKKADRFTSKGYFSLKKVSSLEHEGLIRNERCEYFFEGSSQKGSFKIKKAAFKTRNFKIDLWGTYSQGSIFLNGYSQYRSLLSYDKPSAEIRGIIDKFKMLFTESGYVPDQDYGFRSVNNIFDIECALRIVSPNVFVDNLQFTLGDIQYKIKGDLAFLDKLLIDLSLRSSIRRTMTPDRQGQGNLTVKLKGEVEDYAFSGYLDINSLKAGPGGILEDKCNFQAYNLRFSARNDDLISLNLDKLAIESNFRQKKYGFVIDDFSVFLDYRNKRVKTIDFNSRLYQGFLTGKASLDSGYQPSHWGIDFMVLDSDPEHFVSLLPFLSKVEGNLLIKGSFLSHPEPELKGEVFIDNGRLKDIGFFKWLAKFFKLPQLAEVEFSSLEADFLALKGTKKLEAVDLNSENVKLNGFYHVLESDLVSGLFSIRISRDLLQNSPRFNSLVKLLGEDFSYLDFEFKLSGLYGEINFKWLDSKFKQGLQDSIPDFFQRGIERRLEKIINQLNKSN